MKVILLAAFVVLLAVLEVSGRRRKSSESSESREKYPSFLEIRDHEGCPLKIRHCNQRCHRNRQNAESNNCRDDELCCYKDKKRRDGCCVPKPSQETEEDSVISSEIKWPRKSSESSDASHSKTEETEESFSVSSQESDTVESSKSSSSSSEETGEKTSKESEESSEESSEETDEKTSEGSGQGTDYVFINEETTESNDIDGRTKNPNSNTTETPYDRNFTFTEDTTDVAEHGLSNITHAESELYNSTSINGNFEDNSTLIDNSNNGTSFENNGELNSTSSEENVSTNFTGEGNESYNATVLFVEENEDHTEVIAETAGTVIDDDEELCEEEEDDE